MKTKCNIVRLMFATAVLGTFASFAYAGPGIQHWQTIRRQSEFKELKTGDKVAYVCNMCKSVSEVGIESTEHAMELCKEGATVMCPSCKMKAKVVTKRQRNDAPLLSEVTYTNEKGEECVFIAKISDKK